MNISFSSVKSLCVHDELLKTMKLDIKQLKKEAMNKELKKKSAHQLNHKKLVLGHFVFGLFFNTIFLVYLVELTKVWSCKGIFK